MNREPVCAVKRLAGNNCHDTILVLATGHRVHVHLMTGRENEFGAGRRNVLLASWDLRAGANSVALVA